ncbi:Hypothetical predicted protein [Pelobates cultripes]|uniref:Uncharacterized protein n=1 Tax=Pelobates cultripes TaxID=61616 RepID=A0AAD1VN32_PELCU|nr:Hypothetical predicted protein [Pelobates cultripes]
MLQTKLRDLELEKTTYMLRRYKYNFFTQGNRAGALLAAQRKACNNHSKIAYVHTTYKQKLTNPQDIVNAFASYYSTLYNLKEDPGTTSTPASDIQDFLSPQVVS